MDTSNDRLNQILAEAVQVFALYGYKKASMEDIAGRVGMTKGNLYFYCDNKQDLYEKAVTHALLRWQDRVRSAVDTETDIVDKFMALATKSYDYLAEDSDLRALIMKDPNIQAVTPSEDRYPSIGQASYSMVADIISEAISEGRFRPVDIDHVAGFIYSVYCMFIIKTYAKSEGHSAREMYRAGLDVILHGLLTDR